MRPSRPPKKQAWNRGQVVGQKRAFTPADLARIEARLLEDANWHDLALLSFGLDTMFRASDLLTTQVWQVQYRHGPVRTMIARRQRKTNAIVSPVLTPSTRCYLQRWIEHSGKSPAHYLFTRTKPIDAPPITRPSGPDSLSFTARR